MSEGMPSCASKTKITTALIDLSGTIHVGDTAVGHAVSALSRLRGLVKHVKFVTNTTKESGSLLYNRLKSLGFDIERSEIFTSLIAARDYVLVEQLRPLLLLEQEALEDFESVDTNNPNAVVVGLAPSQFNYSTLNNAFQLLSNQPNATLVGIHKGRYYRKPDGNLHLGPGGFIAALEYAAEKQAVVLGKPEAQFFLGAVREFEGVLPENCVMIGDDVRDDVAGAQGAGMRGILVKTGKYREGDETKITPAPWYAAQDFDDAVTFLEKFVNS